MPKCRAHSKRHGGQCRAWALTGKSLCRNHGGKNEGTARANEYLRRHNLYSKTLGNDPELLEAYEYFKSNPDMLNTTPEIAMAQAFLDKFLKQAKVGVVVSAEYVAVINDFLQKIAKLKELEHKRRVGEQLTIRIEDTHESALEALK